MALGWTSKQGVEILPLVDSYEDTGGGSRRSLGWMGTDVSHPILTPQ